MIKIEDISEIIDSSFRYYLHEVAFRSEMTKSINRIVNFQFGKPSEKQGFYIVLNDGRKFNVEVTEVKKES